MTYLSLGGGVCPKITAAERGIDQNTSEPTETACGQEPGDESFNKTEISI